jgi:formate dehydrogenase assembly factor FdhD
VVEKGYSDAEVRKNGEGKRDVSHQRTHLAVRMCCGWCSNHELGNENGRNKWNK